MCPGINWWPVQGVPHLCATVVNSRLWQSSDPERDTVVYKDGWMEFMWLVLTFMYLWTVIQMCPTIGWDLSRVYTTFTPTVARLGFGNTCDLERDTVRWENGWMDGVYLACFDLFVFMVIQMCPGIGWWPVQGVSRLCPTVINSRPWQPSDPERDTADYEDGWMYG